ncbi:hypothetical protein AB0J90_01610 [Micromonospora sp. NPDC049523]|uniref:hypothetical protein n=1 Tax=Micromonospora sp. NPDC049523 TaxID=3155921 RepID=UPI003423645D
MEPITLHRWFRPWSYGIGHSQLVLHADADSSDNEHIDVLFEDVRAVKLGGSYRPLILEPADPDTRAGVLAFAQIPVRHQARYLCLTLPKPDAEPGFILCARATVLASETSNPRHHPVRNEQARVLHLLKHEPAT